VITSDSTPQLTAGEPSDIEVIVAGYRPFRTPSDGLDVMALSSTLEARASSSSEP
jgi:hypothetical protein